VSQRLVFFSILSTLYITPIFYIFKKRNSSLLSPIFISTLFFVDDGLFISQEKSYKKSNTNLFYNYSIISSLFKQFYLTVEHNKLEIFYFSKWRQYLLDAVEPFEVWTDHENLKYFREPYKLNR